MAYKIKIKSSERGNGLMRYNDNVWYLLNSLENGLFMQNSDRFYLKTNDNKIFEISKSNKNSLHLFSQTFEIERQEFNVYNGRMPNGTQFLFYEFQNSSINDRFLIGSVYGGLTGTVVELSVDFDNILDDFDMPNEKNTKKQKQTDDDYTLPIELGDAKTKVLEVFEDYETDFELDMLTIGEFGLHVTFDKDDFVREISLGKSVFSKHPIDYIFGITSGDKYIDCIKIWGDPQPAKEEDFQTHWYYKKHNIAIMFWEEDADGSDINYPDYKKNTVRNIEITKI